MDSRTPVPAQSPSTLGRGDDAVGDPHRAQNVQFELVELILLFKLDKQLPVEHFEAIASQSTVPSPLSYTKWPHSCPPPYGLHLAR